MSLIAGNLGAVQRLLDEAGWSWGIFAGAAAHLYGTRRPIANVDILVAPGFLRQVRGLLEKNQLVSQYDGRILLWRGIKMFDDISMSIGPRRHPFLLDAPMQEHLRRLPLLGSRVLVLAPEDVLAHKALLLLRGDGPLAKGHRQDLEAIIRIQGANLELEYLCRRLELCQAPPDVRTLLIQKGLALPDS